MFYIFNKQNKCVGTCDYTPNIEDLETRGEVCVESNEDIDISKCILKDGVVSVAPVVEPSAAELKMTAISAIKAKYEVKFKGYETSLIRARLANNETQVTKIQEQYKVSRHAMALEIAGA